MSEKMTRPSFLMFLVLFGVVAAFALRNMQTMVGKESDATEIEQLAGAIIPHIGNGNVVGYVSNDTSGYLWIQAKFHLVPAVLHIEHGYDTLLFIENKRYPIMDTVTVKLAGHDSMFSVEGEQFRFSLMSVRK